jgi:hypothetical protein
MSQRATAIMWLALCIFCALLTLALFAGGGYSIWQTHSNVLMCEKRIEEDEIELKNPKTRQVAGKMDLIDERLRATDKELHEHERNRYYAIAATGIGIVPALMSLAFMAMFFMKWFKKPRAKSTQDMEDEDDTEEDPPPKPNDKNKN